MLKKMTFRWRVTLYSAFLLTACCILLTCILNFFAYRMADYIDAVQTTPALPSFEDGAGQAAAYIMPSMHSEVPLIQLETSKQARWAFGHQSLLCMALIVVGGSGLTYFIVGKALRPLQMLDAQVKNMTVSHLSETLSVTDADDEIAALTRSFNDMTNKLNEAFLAQQHFSANAAHELRTPLAVLQTKVDVFKKSRCHTVQEYDALIEVFEKQTERLCSLVRTLLDMTNIDDVEDQTNVPIKEMLEDIIDELTPAASARAVELFLDCKEWTVFGNIDLLYRAFYNLIENGIKYNRHGGKVWIYVTRDDLGQTDIRICDTGIGIPDDMKMYIFEPFFRVDKSRSRAMGGAGLGLAMAKRIITKHHGSITVKDREGGGSCFEIILIDAEI